MALLLSLALFPETGSRVSDTYQSHQTGQGAKPGSARAGAGQWLSINLALLDGDHNENSCTSASFTGSPQGLNISISVCFSFPKRKLGV